MGRVSDYDQPSAPTQAAHSPQGDVGPDPAQRQPHGEWGKADSGGEEGRGHQVKNFSNCLMMTCPKY